MQTFQVTTQIYSGKNSLNVLKQWRDKKIFIVCDAFISKTQTYQRVVQILGEGNTQLFSDITPDPDIATVVTGIQAMAQFQPDLVIGLGGGSSIDAAKAMVYFAKKMGLNIQECIAIPTTSGTGSEVTSATVITDPSTGTKYPLFEQSIYPNAAILDPDLVVTVPQHITANTGLDVLTHAFEAYVSTNAGDFSNAYAEKAIQLVFTYLPGAYKDGENMQCREKMHNASAMAGMAFSHAGLGINHAIAHQLGGQFHVPHGLANAILMPAVIEYNAQNCERSHRRYARIAKKSRIANLNASDEQALNLLLNHIRNLQAELGMATTLTELGIDAETVESKMVALIQGALNDSTLPTTPVQPSALDIRKIIEAIL
ncbi:MAG: 1-propanol dehydrogenase PduQ [Vibrio sp.]